MQNAKLKITLAILIISCLLAWAVDAAALRPNATASHLKPKVRSHSTPADLAEDSRQNPALNSALDRLIIRALAEKDGFIMKLFMHDVKQRVAQRVSDTILGMPEAIDKELLIRELIQRAQEIIQNPTLQRNEIDRIVLLTYGYIHRHLSRRALLKIAGAAAGSISVAPIDRLARATVSLFVPETVTLFDMTNELSRKYWELSFFDLAVDNETYLLGTRQFLERTFAGDPEVLATTLAGEEAYTRMHLLAISRSEEPRRSAYSNVRDTAHLRGYYIKDGYGARIPRRLLDRNTRFWEGRGPAIHTTDSTLDRHLYMQDAANAMEGLAYELKKAGNLTAAGHWNQRANQISSGLKAELDRIVPLQNEEIERDHRKRLDADKADEAKSEERTYVDAYYDWLHADEWDAEYYLAEMLELKKKGKILDTDTIQPEDPKNDLAFEESA